MQNKPPYKLVLYPKPGKWTVPGDIMMVQVHNHASGLPKGTLRICEGDAAFSSNSLRSYILAVVSTNADIKAGDHYITDGERYQCSESGEEIMRVANMDSSSTYRNTHFKEIASSSKDNTPFVLIHTSLQQQVVAYYNANGNTLPSIIINTETEFSGMDGISTSRELLVIEDGYIQFEIQELAPQK